MPTGCVATRNLTLHDEEILQRIFNPQLPFPDDIEQRDTAGITLTNKEGDSIETAEVTESKRLELEGVQAADEGQTQKAFHLFSEAIKLSPDSASGYNNRAQALRLLSNNEGAELDLNKAITLTGGRGSAACQAYTQRALLRRLKNDNDGALADFKSAAQLGGAFAKSQVIALNPYAAMCGAIVSEMMEQERNVVPKQVK